MTLNFDKRTHFILQQVSLCCKEGQKVYLVGGAVRDAILSKPLKDLDFVSNFGSMSLARCVQRSMNGESYTLDDKRHSARVILDRNLDTELTLDFVVFTGKDLLEDLRQRDFTINAMAVDLDDFGTLIDPLNGLMSLRDKELRVAGDDSISSDPLRAIRALRFSRSMGFTIDDDSIEMIKKNGAGLQLVAGERVRDELFKLLSLPDSARSLHYLESFGLLPSTLPDLDQLRLFPRIDPHVHALWQHTMALVNHLESLLGYILNDEIYDNLYLQHACEQLTPWRKMLSEHMRTAIQPSRSRKALLVIAAVYHDVGKPLTMKTDEEGLIHFYRHPLYADDSLLKLGRRLSLSNAELDYLQKIVRNHMRIHTLTSSEVITDRAIYRYFSDLGPYGVDLALLSMADTLAAREEMLTVEDWHAEVSAGIGMIRAWFERKSEVVEPKRLLDGFELQNVLNLQPGKQLGNLLMAIREAQAAGELRTKEDVIAFSRKYLSQKLEV